MTEIMPIERITGKNISYPQHQGDVRQKFGRALWKVETSQLKKAVKRHIDRFPEDFMFELTKDEMPNWHLQ